MGKDVFISHANQDRRIAEQVCVQLESAGIACWIAPRDVTPGKPFGDAIMDAIESTRAIVVILSEHSNDSVHVRNEVERAVSKRKTIFPVRVQDVKPERALELFLSSAHWIDAWEPPLSKSIAHLVEAVRHLLDEQQPIGSSGDATAARRRRWKARMWTIRRAGKRFGWAAGAVAVLASGLWFHDPLRRLVWTQTGLELAIEGPALAEISVAGRLIGQGGREGKQIALDAGDHKLAIEAQGYWPYEKTVSVKRGATERLVVKMIPVNTLTVSTAPGNAKVEVDGRPIDAKQGIQLRDGNHIVDVSAPGYDPERQMVALANGKTTSISVSLPRSGRGGGEPPTERPRAVTKQIASASQVGVLEVTVEPPDATIQVDGRVVGRATQLAPGSHVLEVNAAGHNAHQQAIEIQPNQTQRVSVALSRTTQQAAAAAPAKEPDNSFAGKFKPAFGESLGQNLGRSLGNIPR